MSGGLLVRFRLQTTRAPALNFGKTTPAWEHLSKEKKGKGEKEKKRKKGKKGKKGKRENIATGETSPVISSLTIMTFITRLLFIS